VGRAKHQRITGADAYKGGPGPSTGNGEKKTRRRKRKRGGRAGSPRERGRKVGRRGRRKYPFFRGGKSAMTAFLEMVERKVGAVLMEAIVDSVMRRRKVVKR